MSDTRRLIPRPLMAAAALSGLVVVGTACRVDVDLSGEEIIREFEVTEFDEIEVGNAFDVFIWVGEEPSVTVRVDEQIEDRVEVVQDGNRLEIGFDDGLFTTSGKAQVEITTTDLRLLDLDGAVSARIVGLEADRLEVDIDGASNVNGRGSVGVLVVDADGASRLDFDRATIDLVEIDADGASSIEVRGATEVTGRAGGASSIHVSEEAVTRIDTSGVSSIDRD